MHRDSSGAASPSRRRRTAVASPALVVVNTHTMCPGSPPAGSMAVSSSRMVSRRRPWASFTMNALPPLPNRQRWAVGRDNLAYLGRREPLGVQFLHGQLVGPLAGDDAGQGGLAAPRTGR